SGLDVSFARVNLSSAQLLLVQARNDTARAFAALAAASGRRTAPASTLLEEPLPAAPPPDSAPLVADALRQRPALAAARSNAAAAARFADAEGDLSRPSVTAAG